jgi:diguanylate cyclase (GGDEF)-like protein
MNASPRCPPRVVVLTRDAYLRGRLFALIEQEGYGQLPGPSRRVLDGLSRGDVDIAVVDTTMATPPLLERLNRRFPGLHTIALLDRPDEASESDTLRLGVAAAIPRPTDDLESVRRALRRVADMVWVSRGRLAMADRLAESAALGALDRSAKSLLSELLALYSGAVARGGPLDMRMVHALARRATAELFIGRTVHFLGHDAAGRCLRADGGLELPLDADESDRLPELDDRDPLVNRLRAALRAECALATPVGTRSEVNGVLVVLGSRERPFLASETGLLHRFGEWLSLCFDGARLYKEVLDLSVIDGLTGLYNHRFFHDRLRDEVARAARHARSVSLLFCDIDDFKLYNDRNGHTAGDLVLKTLGQILRNEGDGTVAFRESDVRARYGGEEFAVILPETPFESAIAKAERLRAAVEGTHFPAADAQPHGRLTVSVGISEFPRHATDKHELLERADLAMYQAKLAGKNRVVAARI